MRIAPHLCAMLAALALYSATPVAAQVPASTPVADADSLAAARGFLKVVDIRSQMRAISPKLGQAMMAQMQAQWAERKIPDGLSTQIDGALQTFMASLDEAFTPQVVDQLATIYARHFSAADLRHLTDLMNDPVMQRYKAGIPGLLGEEMPVLFAAMKPQQEAFQSKLKQIVADWIRQHPADRAKLAHPIAS